MTAITVTDPLFGNIASLTNPTFMADVVRLINEAPNLVAEINTIDATNDLYGGKASIITGDEGFTFGSTAYHSQYISVPVLPNYNDSTTRYLGGSLTASEDEATPAATFVGSLSHEASRWLDSALAPLYVDNQTSNYSIEQAVATEIADIGKADYAQYLTKMQIDAANGGTGTGYYAPANSIQQDTNDLRLVSHLAGVGQAESYLGSQVWNGTGPQSWNGAVSPSGTYLSNIWSLYSNSGTVNYLGLDPTKITNFTVQTNDAGVLVGSTIQTAALDYAFTYSAVGNETAAVSNAAGTLLYTDVFDTDQGSTPYDLDRYQSYGTFAQDSNAVEIVTGNVNSLTDAGKQFIIQGNQNELTSFSANGNDIFVGDNNAFFDNAATGSSTLLSLNGASNIAVLGAAHTDISDAGANSEVFGGSGTLVYDGGTGYGDVIGSTGSTTIHAGAGGGWYEGGTDGHNFIQGSDSGLGTILAAGGNGDTVTGGSHGGDYFLAAMGNETLTGGNSFGTQVMFLGSGKDFVTTGSASSIIDTGIGSAVINDFGQAVVYGGTGKSDIFTAAAGHMDIVGFRTGTDHVSGSIATASIHGGSTLIQLSDGATITLLGVATSHFS